MEIAPAAPTSAASPPQGFTGAVLADELAALPGAAPVHVYGARFAPGARTIWHRRRLGQVLCVTEGAGLIQRRGGPVAAIAAGDVVRIGPGEWTWFGAGPATAMAHLSIKEEAGDGTDSELGAPLTDAEYAAAAGD